MALELNFVSARTNKRHHHLQVFRPFADGPPERTGQVAHARYAARSSVSWW